MHAENFGSLLFFAYPSRDITRLGARLIADFKVFTVPTENPQK